MSKHLFLTSALSLATLLPAVPAFAEQMPVTWLGTEISSAARLQPAGGKAECQPENFDPAVAGFHKDTLPDGEPSSSYLVDNDPDYSRFMIDGWNKEGDHKIVLPEPYELKDYEFGCLSESSHVLEIKKDGKRQALYQHVDAFFVDTGTLTMFMLNSRRLPDGKYAGFRGFVDIPSGRTTPIPRLACLRGESRFDGGKFISYGAATDIRGAKGPTEICVWDRLGNLQARLSARLFWHGCANSGGDCSLYDAVRMLPGDPGVLAIYSAFGKKDCRLVLVNLAEALTRFAEPGQAAGAAGPAGCAGKLPAGIGKIRWDGAKAEDGIAAPDVSGRSR